MTPPPVIYDGLRLYLGASAATPRGVDRVELAYARYFLESFPGECFGVLPTPWGMRLYDRAISKPLLAYILKRWRENLTTGADPALAYVRQRLLGHPAVPRTSAVRRRQGMLTGVPRALVECGVHLGRSAPRAAPRNAIYVNVGQLCWAAPSTSRWLRHRPDIRAVFMLHDVIPLERTEFVSRGARMAMDWMLRTVVKRAAGLITTTQSASVAVTARLRQLGLPEIPICAVHLPVSGVFLQNDPPDHELRQNSYFLVCGAIEPRKNTLLLLDVWQQLIHRMGSEAPRLVIAGTAEKRGEPILAELSRRTSLRDHVIIVSGLASPSLRQLMANARALLMPSFAEGFGLPVVEALSLGTPVIASNIEAHREIGGQFACYLDPSDRNVWMEAIIRMMHLPDKYADLRLLIERYQPLTEAQYFSRIQNFLGTIA